MKIEIEALLDNRRWSIVRLNMFNLEQLFFLWAASSQRFIAAKRNAFKYEKKCARETTLLTRGAKLSRGNREYCDS